jgi:hypothetical protein
LIRKRLAVLHTLLAFALVALGVGADLIRGRRTTAGGRHRYTRRTAHAAGVAGGSSAQRNEVLA